jgi:peptidase E
MNLALTSDFPSTPNHAVVARIQSLTANPRVAWISPTTAQGRARFPAAQGLFRSFGVLRLEYCDIDQEPSSTQFEQLADYDVLYLTGGDPRVFRDNLRRVGLADRLRTAVTSGQLIVGASGGAMQLTKNVSLFLLRRAAVDDVIGTHSQYGGLGIVNYEVLPHLGRHDANFLAQVRQYSARVPHDLIALDDGAAVIYEDGRRSQCVGRALRFRGGRETPIETASSPP